MPGTLNYGDILSNMQVGPFQTITPDSTATNFVATTIPQINARTFNNPSRTVNTAFQISTTQDAEVNYSVDITTSVSLSGGASGTVFLEYADNSAFTTNVKSVSQYTNANTGTLVVGLTLNQIGTAALSGLIPASKYVRLRTNNNTGTPTYGTPVSQEVLL